MGGGRGEVESRGGRVKVMVPHPSEHPSEHNSEQIQITLDYNTLV